MQNLKEKIGMLIELNLWYRDYIWFQYGIIIINILKDSRVNNKLILKQTFEELILKDILYYKKISFG